MTKPSEMTTLAHFASILDAFGIEYAVGGSMASSAYGTVRFTEDADITVEPFEDRAEQFFESVKADYYISKDAMLSALKRRSSFNIIHLESAFKIDVFVRGDAAFDKQVMSRRKLLRLSPELDKSFWVVTPEDISLLKLRWYQDGGRVSERQWDDIAGILRIQAETLDFAYLRKWATILGVNELLENALSDVRD